MAKKKRISWKNRIALVQDKKLPNRNNPNIARPTSGLIAAKTEFYQGEYPSGKMFQEYEDVRKGLGDDIFNLIKSETEHRRDLQRTIIESDFAEKRRGQKYGLLVSLSFLFVSGLLIYVGKEISGTIIGGTTLVSLVTVFVTGRSTRQTKREIQPEQKA